MEVKIAVVDDHRLFRLGLMALIESYNSQYRVILDANDGKEFLERIDPNNVPDLLLLDENMPYMSGYETAVALKEKYPKVKVLIITMIEEEEKLIRMLKIGVNGYLSKDVEPDELKEAIETILKKGFYYTDYLTGKLIQMVGDKVNKKKTNPILSEQELRVLKFICRDFSYKQIAEEMDLSIKTVETYRVSLFDKLNVKSRVGLVMYAVKNGIITT
jgi:two-component system, NarL family, invasion response regulator UvrY